MAKEDDKILIKSGHNYVKKCRNGYMLYNINDQYVGRSLHYYGEFSILEAMVLTQLVAPGATVLDIGANLGAHTLALATAVGPTGRVYAFEPQRIVFQQMCTNMALNSMTNAYCNLQAVGDAAGTITVPWVDYEKFSNFGGVALGKWEQGDEIEVVTIDSLQLSQCRLIKVDVEGMESLVIHGAKETITNLRPILYLENDRREHSHELIELIMSFNYRLYWHKPPLYNPHNFYENQENLFEGLSSWNMLCFPREQEHSIEGFPEVKGPDDWPDNWRMDVS